MTNRPESPVLRLDLESPTPVYRQIVDGLRALLVVGVFQPGDRLPTVRQLAIDLGVNHNTVAGAYRLLEEEGWIELRRHHGATVIPRSIPPAPPARHQDFVQRLRELTAQAIADGVDVVAVAKQLGLVADDLKKQKPGIS